MESQRILECVEPFTMKRFQIVASSLLSIAGVAAAVAVGSPSLADTVDARCDVVPAGDDKATSSGLCSFSQRQGFVGIQLKNGTRIELRPNEATPNAFFDAQGEPAKSSLKNPTTSARMGQLLNR